MWGCSVPVEFTLQALCGHEGDAQSGCHVGWLITAEVHIMFS